ncbi:hypothetical protein [Kordia sp.]|uniref:hypothetical protein n=1 Tax=Kordia sp. TaxID=1965332 RepID=UPI003B5C1B63
MKKYIVYLLMIFVLFNCSDDDAPTQELAEVQITNVSDVTVDAAQVISEVITNGGTTITSRGICWSTTQNPTINDDTTNNGTGTGVYTSNITSLVPNSTYYIRAYVINATGTAYSEQEELSTNLPEVNIAAITNITGTSAESGGEVTNEGGASVTAKGICWSTSPNPITTDNVTNDGDGIGTFTSTLTGLTENETYYVRAYATNNIGTAYSDEVEFVSNACISANVTTETITLSTQQEVDDFHYSSIGGLIIMNTNITDLSPLSCLTLLDGGLTIVNNSNLVSLTGLENITAINGYINISNNSSLESIHLDNFMSVNSGNTYWEDASPTFVINGNTNLLSINMPNLEGFGGALVIESNSILTSINMSSLNSLTVLRISGNTQLSSTNYSSLSNVGTVAVGNGSLRGVFTINGTQLTNLDGFGGLSSTALRSFTIANNPLLENVNMLSNASIRSTNMVLVNNDALVNIQGLSNTGTVYEEISLVIDSNDALTNIDGASNFLGGLLYSVNISNNDALTNVDVMSALGGCIYGGVTVENNNVLTNLCGLTNYANALINNNDMYGPCILNLSGNAYNPSPQDIVDGNCSQ